MPVEAGLTAEVGLTVSETDTAIHFRSGEVPVVATPRLIALCEEATVKAVAGHVGPGETTVGMSIQVEHLVPTAVGQHLRAECTLERVEGRRLRFTVAVHDDRQIVAAGRITRYVVDTERFLDKTR